MQYGDQRCQHEKYQQEEYQHGSGTALGMRCRGEHYSKGMHTQQGDAVHGHYRTGAHGACSAGTGTG